MALINQQGRIFARCSRTDRLKQHRIPMEIEKLFLSAGEAPDIHDSFGLDSHPFQLLTMGDR
jgi:hypothetical protein